MRLGLTLGYGGTSATHDVIALARHADRLGYSVVWAAEAYGSDAPTVLAFVAAQTERIDVGSAVMQIPGRTPACTAMTAATLDGLSGGRFRLGLGVSGPQVSEGWHGVRFDRPLERTREYVEIVRTTLTRQPLRYEGRHWTLPIPDGPGKPLRLTVRPVRERIPVYLAAIGPRNVELAGEIADGWLAIFFAPEHAAASLEWLRCGRVVAGRTMAGFDVAPTVPLVVGDDLDECATPVRAYSALYLGGMGSREHNFYNDHAVRMGYADAAARIQELFLDGKHRAAAAAVPFEFVDQTALIGPIERIRDRLPAYAEAGTTTLTVSLAPGAVEEQKASLRALTDALEDAGLADGPQ